MLGVGGLGRTVALELAADQRVRELVLVDRKGERSRALRPIAKTAEVTALQVDVSRREALVPVLSKVDVAVNATLPEHNLGVMAACLDAGCAYVDGAGLSPVAPGERPGVLDQLDQDLAWRGRGQVALVSLGSDPGVSNIMARAAAERLARVDEIRILKGAAGGGEAADYPLYSREIFLRDALSPPTVWDGGKLVPQGYVSGLETYPFPAPVGPRRVYHFYHEEVLTLPLRLGRPVAKVAYKHDINPDLVTTIVALSRLGLLAPDRRVKVGLTPVSFKEAFLATFPEPSTLIGPMAGAMAIVAEARGTKADGTRTTVRGSIVLEHKEANRLRGTTAERFLTAAAAVAGVSLIAEKKLPRTGVLAPEELPPDVIVPELEARGVHFTLEETAG